MVDREKKLFEPRNVDGRARSSEAVGKLRVLEHLLSGNPAFVGLEIGGSFYKGYGDLERGSDVDFTILIDSKKEGIQVLSGMWSLQKQFVAQNPDFQYLGTTNLAQAPFTPGAWDGTERDVVLALIQKVTGRKVSEYRQRAGAWLISLDSPTRERFLKELTTLLRAQEQAGMQKYVFRKLDSEFERNNHRWIEEGYAENEDDIQNARDGLWTSIHNVAKNNKFQAQVRKEVNSRMQKWQTRIEKMFGFSV